MWTRNKLTGTKRRHIPGSHPVELEDLNAEAARLAKTIKKNFEELGI